MKKDKIIVWLLFFSINLFCTAIVCSAEEVKSTANIKQEFMKKHPEVLVLKNYLKEVSHAYEGLKNKYIWSKSNKIRPAEEARKLMYPGYEIYDDRSMERVYSKFPWGGWSRKWSKKLDALSGKVKAVETSSSESFKLRMEILFVLDSLFILRSDYEFALDGEKADISYSVSSIDEALAKCREILSLDSVVKREKRSVTLDKKLPVVFDLNEGTINSFKMKNFIDMKAIIKSIEEEPNKIQPGFWSVYNYYDRGFCVLLEEVNNKKTKIGSITIYLKEVEYYYNDDYYKKFEGKIIPLGNNENRQTIKQKFGDSYEISNPKSSGPAQWRYKKPYGKLNFTFGEDGKLKIVSMFSGD